MGGACARGRVVSHLVQCQPAGLTFGEEGPRAALCGDTLGCGAADVSDHE